MNDPLTDEVVERVLASAPARSVAVLGDLFLDRYLDIDAALTEPSLETGLDAYQVTGVRSSPGAAGTVINNLVALGVGRVVPVSVIGDDGEGYELRQALAARGLAESLGGVHVTPRRRTPTYTKPMLHTEAGNPARELNRLDIKNRRPLERDLEDAVLASLGGLAGRVDALLVLDQVSEPDCGVVTARVREWLADAGAKVPALTLADSRERIGLFRGVLTKPNGREAVRATGAADVGGAVRRLMAATGRPVFCTCGAAGLLVGDPTTGALAEVPGYPVSGPVDVVGAGDSVSAGLACALAAGATPAQAAAFGNLVASITVRQLGTTGTASPEQVRQRWRDVSRVR